MLDLFVHFTYLLEVYMKAIEKNHTDIIQWILVITLTIYYIISVITFNLMVKTPKHFLYKPL